MITLGELASVLFDPSCIRCISVTQDQYEKVRINNYSKMFHKIFDGLAINGINVCYTSNDGVMTLTIDCYVDDTEYLKYSKLESSEKYNISDDELKFHEMWKWIAEWTYHKKKKMTPADYFEFFRIPKEKIPYEESYVCEHAHKQLENGDKIGAMCSRYCPITWGKDMFCRDVGSLYEQWVSTEDWKEAMILAKQISMLRWNNVKEQTNAE